MKSYSQFTLPTVRPPDPGYISSLTGLYAIFFLQWKEPYTQSNRNYPIFGITTPIYLIHCTRRAKRSLRLHLLLCRLRFRSFIILLLFTERYKCGPTHSLVSPLRRHSSAQSHHATVSKHYEGLSTETRSLTPQDSSSARIKTRYGVGTISSGSTRIPCTQISFRFHNNVYWRHGVEPCLLLLLTSLLM